MCLLSRFFTKEKDPKVPPRNPPSGTVVDDVVTLPERYDFYVISQSVRQVSRFLMQIWMDDRPGRSSPLI